MNVVPLLSAEQERLVADNFRLVRWVIFRYRLDRTLPAYLDVDDLIGEGLVGLMRAARSFDADRGAFATHAVPKIRSAVESVLKKASAQKRGGAGAESGYVGFALSLDHLRDELGFDLPSAVIVGPAPETLLASVLETAASVDRRLPQIIALRAEGLTYYEVGREVGLSHERVRQLCLKLHERVADRLSA